MTTTTVFAADDGYIHAEDYTYLTARSTATTAYDNIDAIVGQFIGGTPYYIREGFYSFETANAITDGDVVSQVDLMLWLNQDFTAGSDFVCQARTHDWGDPTVEIGDWVAGADLSAKTLLATLDTNGIGSTGAYKTFTSEGAPFNSAIQITGTTDNTEILVCSNRHVNADVPTGAEYVQFESVAYTGDTRDPKLVITHDAGATATTSMIL